ncbi:DUF6058 family natural product biosynthesis protein [Massilia antarctica]|uniref:DUF6058 family natural product biosynthesis protein n=1 Tax=Massilia antarctica TaxID=2765360 RepID=UPI0006BB5F5C|nr:DUF6058 family natural product biosynthesis protein [Massilia sp. H27-R4]MCY0912126.1 DUF6058 family natural product biosynthesis protein [Massilia sp. H27-R4]CUI06402.1 hypothetical protein BN2497_7581 [Janthinobacterium sp. CG23_2]CUU30188.1 hypothetical protein BN3177_7581 [Janthinobacterium sp. CG23_2]
MELIRYLSDCFFTEEQLLAVSGIDADELAALQQRAMMPRPSYRLRLDVSCDSFFGMHQEHTQLDYYAKGYASWIGLLHSLGGEGEAFRVFAERYRGRLAQLKAAGLCTDNPKLGAGLDQHLREEWRHFLDGTYGLCTKTGLPEEIASKELATMIIREIIGKPLEQLLSTRDRICLTLAVDLLDTASSQFAPHERERSSRHSLIDEVRKTYQL